ncbi:hypothetical protein T11_11696 [Trichinella zimbabwensis]|uniref:Uncharacterized protein n=1 Tax=Trichinella zimbabwensis TaxID=268475 RepID=A0A0V1HX17_9BILA|nr:hypothetical protein T11_11696 [Trichinella zimbabwensis]
MSVKNSPLRPAPGASGTLGMLRSCISPGCYITSNFAHFFSQLFSMSGTDLEWKRAYEVNGVGDKVPKLPPFDSRTVRMKLRPIHTVRLIFLGSIKTSLNSRKAKSINWLEEATFSSNLPPILYRDKNL